MKFLPGSGARRCLQIGMLLAILAVGAGCNVNMMALPYFLMFGEPRIDPPVKLLDGRKDKKKLLVVAYASPGLQWGSDVVDEELTGVLIGEIMRSEPRMEVVPERKVRDWRDRNPNWKDQLGKLQQVGEHFDVDYILFLEILGFATTEANNPYLLRGKTNILTRIHDVKKDEMIFDDTYTRQYPINRPIPITEVATEEQFRSVFLRAIAKELSWYVISHPISEDDKKE